MTNMMKIDNMFTDCPIPEENKPKFEN